MAEQQTQARDIAEARLVALPSFPDDRGTLTFGQVGAQLPFVPQRFFTITGVPKGGVRGEHAHRLLHQFLVCLHGGCTIMIDDGRRQQTFRLDSPAVALHVPPLHWNRLYDFTPDAVLLCLSSGAYDRAEYIPDYETFQRMTARP